MTPLRDGFFFPRERALDQETSATQLAIELKREQRELEGDFQLEPPLPRAIRCFAFGLDTETEIKNGRTFHFSTCTTNKLFCQTSAARVIVTETVKLQAVQTEQVIAYFRILTLLT